MDLDLSVLSDEASQQIADVLQQEVSRHRPRPGAEWSLPPETVDKLEKVQERIMPDSPAARHAWLFGSYSRLLDELPEDSWENLDEAALPLQRQALREILATGGLRGVLDLIQLAGSPASAGLVLGKAELLSDDGEIVPTLLVSEDESAAAFAAGYVQGRFDDRGWDWASQLPLAEWSSLEAGNLVLQLPFERRTWELVAQLGDRVSDYYWTRTQRFCRDASKVDVEYALSMLLEHDRPAQAIRILAMASFRKCDLESSLIMEALEAGLKLREDGQCEEIPKHRFVFVVQRLFKWLQERLRSDPSFDAQRLATLEWLYLQLLDWDDVAPMALHLRLQETPEFFAEILSDLYRSRSESDEPAQAPDEQRRLRASNAFRLLRTWKTVPGTRDDGTLDDQELTRWATEARELCEQSGRLEVCDITIGELLACSEESDGSPSVAVRDLLEEVATDEFIRGFQIGILGKRGMSLRSATEGGDQERVLASKYESYASACAIEWPRTAAALRQIAKEYEAEARREDEMAQDRV